MKGCFRKFEKIVTFKHSNVQHSNVQTTDICLNIKHNFQGVAPAPELCNRVIQQSTTGIEPVCLTGKPLCSFNTEFDDSHVYSMQDVVNKCKSTVCLKE